MVVCVCVCERLVRYMFRGEHELTFRIYGFGCGLLYSDADVMPYRLR